MKMKQKLKRRALSVILHQAIWFIDHGRGMLFSIRRADNAEGMDKENPLRGALTEKEYKLIKQRDEALKPLIEDLRKIANHLERTSRG